MSTAAQRYMEAKTAFSSCAVVVFIISAASLLVNGGAFGFEERPLLCCWMRVFCGYGAAADVNLAYCAIQYGFLFLGALYFAGFNPDRRCADTAGRAQSVPLRRKLSAVFAYSPCRASAAGALVCRSDALYHLACASAVYIWVFPLQS